MHTETAYCLIASIIFRAVGNRWSSFLCLNLFDMGLNKIEYMASGSNISVYIIKPTTAVGLVFCVWRLVVIIRLVGRYSLVLSISVLWFTVV